jgi:ubiquinone/menaquinone biosynthesis C-methylase UbiE
MGNSSDRLRETVKAEAFHWGAEVAVAYHGRAAFDMDGQWKTLIEPILAQFPIDYNRTIDFAAGYGRNTRKLLEAGAEHVTMVDVNPECIAHLEKHFPHDRTAALLNDGMGLSALETAAFTFLYTFDAMVHFDLEIIIAYITEFSRVLTPGAYAFVHHSNYTANPGGDFRQNPHWRNFMSAGIFKHIAMRSGFDVIQQKMFSWGELPIDCITVLRRNG